MALGSITPETLQTTSIWDPQDIVLLNEMRPLTGIFRQIYFDQELKRKHPPEILKLIYQKIEKLSFSSDIEVGVIERIHLVVSTDPILGSLAFQKISIGEKELSIFRLIWIGASDLIKNYLREGKPLEFNSGEIDFEIFNILNEYLIRRMYGADVELPIREDNLLKFYQTCQFLKVDFKEPFLAKLSEYMDSSATPERSQFFLDLYVRSNTIDPELASEILKMVGYSLSTIYQLGEPYHLLQIHRECIFICENWLNHLLKENQWIDISNLHQLSKRQSSCLGRVLKEFAPAKPPKLYVQVDFSGNAVKYRKKYFELVEPLAPMIAFFSWVDDDSFFCKTNSELAVKFFHQLNRLESLILGEKGSKLDGNSLEIVLKQNSLKKAYLKSVHFSEDVFSALAKIQVKHLALNANFDKCFGELKVSCKHLHLSALNSPQLVAGFFARNLLLKSLSFSHDNLHEIDLSCLGKSLIVEETTAGFGVKKQKSWGFRIKEKKQGLKRKGELLQSSSEKKRKLDP